MSGGLVGMDSGSAWSRGLRAAALGLIAFGLALPLHDLWAYPDRLSVLTSLQVDAQTYDTLAAALAAGGRWTDIPVRQPPGFIALLAVAYAVFGHSYAVARLLLWTCLATSTALAAWLAHRVWGRPAAWAAAVLMATAPALRHYAGTVQYELVAGLQLLALVAVVAAAVTTRGWGRMIALAALGGAAAGLLALTREVFVGVIPIVAVWLVVRARVAVGLRRSLVAGLVFAVVAAAPVVWWSAVQSARHGQLVVISDKGPVTFAFGNNPLASGTFNVVRVSEPSGLRFIRERPDAALRLWGRKAAYFWGLIRDPWNVPRPAGLWLDRATGGLVPLGWSLPLARGGWLLIVLLWAVARLIRTGRWGAWWVLPAVVGAVWAAHIVTLSSHRFAVPVLPLVFVCGAGPIAAWASAGAAWVRAGRWRSALAAGVTLFAVAAQWLGAPPPEVMYSAADLVVTDATNGVDAASGRPVRLALASDPVQPALILADEYLAAGRYLLLLTVKRSGPIVELDTPVARVTVMDVAGATSCREDVPFGEVSAAAFGQLWVPCRLAADGPATLVVEALGRTDLAFDQVVFVRDPHQP